MASSSQATEASPSKIANALSVINGLAPLDDSNYPSWREKLIMAPTMVDIDYAIETPRLTPPVLAAEDTHAAADNPTRQMSRDLENAMWTIKDQFIGSTKAYAGALIKKFVNAEYDGSGIREYIMKMTNMAEQLKSYEMEQKDDFVVHHILNSLPKEFETFIENYNKELRSGQ
ncbi:hypothetical protein U9M48_029206 [Paspalum notatum var. saurae]|uniref:Gag-pol polyprotein n=1 Tax=Paspalum notatum var. saurae TaxID=547442 RepID=A0AAQ3U2I8_PASNO